MTNITYVDYEMADGSTVKLSLTMAQLYKLRKKNKKTYDIVNSIIMGAGADIVGLAEFIYGAYLCTVDDTPSFEEFLEIMNPSTEANAQAVLELRGLGKKQDSVKPS